MPESIYRTTPPRSFWIIGVLALLWNLIGIATYLMTVTMGPEALAALPEAERAMHASTPAWDTSAYAIAVFGATLASVALLMRKAWSVPIFIVSLIAILLQMGFGIFATPLLEVQGAGAAILPLVIVVIAISLVWFSNAAKRKGWIS
jgi:hypothetical protein